MEAFHSLYHPLLDQLRGVLRGGELGPVHSATATFCVPLPSGKDIRWKESLGGGALMDVDGYPVRLLQALFGHEATVVEAQARLRQGVDRSIVARLAFPTLPEARITASMWSLQLLGSGIEVTGDNGIMSVAGPYHPQVGGRIRLRTSAGSRTIGVDRGSTYQFQLEALRDTVANGTPPLSGPADSVAMMTVIDAIDQKAGMLPRQPHAE